MVLGANATRGGAGRFPSIFLSCEPLHAVDQLRVLDGQQSNRRHQPGSKYPTAELTNHQPSSMVIGHVGMLSIQLCMVDRNGLVMARKNEMGATSARQYCFGARPGRATRRAERCRIPSCIACVKFPYMGAVGCGFRTPDCAPGAAAAPV